jgi:Na+-driven multidrug efflux pump
MRRLIILKSLVDFIWIVTCIPLVPIILFIGVYQFFDNSIISLFFNNDEVNIDSTLISKVLIFLALMLVLVFIYCFYLFRKTLRYFQKRKPFHVDVMTNFNKIGALLMISGISSSILFFVFRLFSDSKFQMSLGLTPYIFVICLGLFFMILSEVFMVAKHAKDENELTI